MYTYMNQKKEIIKQEKEISELLSNVSDQKLLYDFTKDINTYSSNIREKALQKITDDKYLYKLAVLTRNLYLMFHLNIVHYTTGFTMHEIVKQITNNKYLYKIAKSKLDTLPLIEQNISLYFIATNLKNQKYLSKFICIKDVSPTEDYFDIALNKITDISILNKALSHTRNTIKKLKIKIRIKELKHT